MEEVKEKEVAADLRGFQNLGGLFNFLKIITATSVFLPFFGRVCF